MFGIARRPTHAQQLRDELAESYSHLKLAAGHAAGGAAEVITPPYDKARSSTSRYLITAFTPLYQQIQQGAANARRHGGAGQRRRRGRLVVITTVLVATGAAVGVAGALVARRRRAMQTQWDEYEPTESFGPGSDFLGDSGGSAGPKEKVSSATRKMTASAASVADSVSSQAGRLAGNLQNKSNGSSKSGSSTEGRSSDNRDDFSSDADEAGRDLPAKPRHRNS